MVSFENLALYIMFIQSNYQHIDVFENSVFPKNKNLEKSSNALWKTTIFQQTRGKLFPQTSGDSNYVTFMKQFFHLMFLFFLNFWMGVNGNKQNNKIGVKSHIHVI